jgi:hypothetical protein
MFFLTLPVGVNLLLFLFAVGFIARVLVRQYRSLE